MDEPVLVRLKPLDSHVHTGHVVADSWIGKPLPSVLMAEESPAEDEVASLFSSDWDCAGCPPPYFDLPPPPRPPFMDDPDYCANDNAVSGDGSGSGSGVLSPYESCEHPLIIDSGAALQNDLLNILIVISCSLVLVVVILLVACVIWRKRRGAAGLSPFRSKTQSSHHPHVPPCAADLSSSSGAGSSSHFSSKSPKVAHFFPSTEPRSDHIELSEHPGRHVYTNPNYPTLEIGGLPFYLMPASAVDGQAQAPGPAGATGQKPAGGLPPLPPSETVVHDTSLILQGSVTSSPQHFTNPNSHHHIYEPGYSTSASQRSGPIYEDIDRMCTYRGSPPDYPPSSQAPAQAHQGQAQNLQQSGSSEDSRTYYNMLPTQLSREKRPGSGGSSSQNCGTSSSEISFESSSSPRHPPPPPPLGNVLINPLSPQHLNRLRASGGATSLRSPQRPSPQNRSPPSKSSSSVYYYSDTLRPKRSLGSGDSDSGISQHNRSSEDTPPPLPLPSSRMAAAAAAALANPGPGSGAASTPATTMPSSCDLRRDRGGFAGGKKKKKATTKV